MTNDGLYDDKVIFRTKGNYSVRWDGVRTTYIPNPGKAATGWGPDVNGRICRHAAFSTLAEAVKWLEEKNDT